MLHAPTALKPCPGDTVMLMGSRPSATSSCFRSSPLTQSTILQGDSSLDGIIEVGLEFSSRGIFLEIP